MKKLETTLKKIAENISKENMETSSNIEDFIFNRDMPGDPNCPICAGVGFFRNDVPVNHPDFGKLFVCTCRQNEISRSEYQRLHRLSNLTAFKDMTFETFKPQGRIGLGEDQINTLTYAYNQAMHFAQQLHGWLLLMGDYGCGKTHLAAAIANYAVELGVPTLFLTVPDLLDWARAAYSSVDETFDERFNEIRNIKLLVLDDLGTENATPWAQEKLFQIINHRYTNRFPTVITTNLDLAKIEDRIRSRLQDPELVSAAKITAPDYRSPMRDSSLPQLSSLHLHSMRTFGNFSLREPEKLNGENQSGLEKAFQAARDYAETPRGWLVLMGSYGCGKTHLAAAIGNYRLGLGESVMFVVVPDLLDHLRSTFNPSSSISYDHLFNQVRTIPLLILDDLGTQSATPWAKEKLYQIFNYRYTAQLPTVITTSSKMEEIDERIRSRMLDRRLCKIFAILVPPYRSGDGAERPPRNSRKK
jgi:DNA replication protein DnaC